MVNLNKQKEQTSVNILKSMGVEEWSNEQLEKAISGGTAIYTEEAIAQYKQDLAYSVKTGQAVDIEKAQKDLGKLVKKIIPNKKGFKQTVYVDLTGGVVAPTAYGKGKQFTPEDVHATHQENMKGGMTEDQSHKRMSMQYRKPLADVKAKQQEGAEASTLAPKAEKKAPVAKTEPKEQNNVPKTSVFKTTDSSGNTDGIADMHQEIRDQAGLHSVFHDDGGHLVSHKPIPASVEKKYLDSESSDDFSNKNPDIEHMKSEYSHEDTIDNLQKYKNVVEKTGTHTLDVSEASDSSLKRALADEYDKDDHSGTGFKLNLSKIKRK